MVRTLAATYGVEPVCQTLGVATSTHYARQNRTPSARDLRDRELVREIRDARAGCRQVYGQANDLARAAPARCSSRPRPGGPADAPRRALRHPPRAGRAYDTA